MSVTDFMLKTISVKNLGSLALDKNCDRCFWLKVRIGFKAPWSIFPGVFGSIDGYSKKITDAWLRMNPGTLPPWLASIGPITEQLPCPHWSKFSFQDPISGITLRGTPDERFLLADGTVAILDYKTSKYVPGKVDELLPMYRVQLGGYRWLTRHLENRETTATRLIYYSPVDEHQLGDNEIAADGFNMRFRGTAVHVETDIDEVESLLTKAKRIANNPCIPPAACGCKDCALLDQLIEMRA